MHGVSALLALTIAVSLDGLAAGFSYGLKKVGFRRGSLLVVAGVSGLLIAVFLAFGQALGGWFSPEVGRWVGALLLMALGLVGMWEVFSRRLDEKHNLEPGDPPTAIWQLRLKKMGLVIQILRDPQEADLDHSGYISPAEAVFLGLALGLDAAGVGLGLGLSGLAGWWLPVLVAVVNLGFIASGQYLGQLSSSWSYPKYMEYIPGLILVLVGLWMVV